MRLVALLFVVLGLGLAGGAIYYAKQEFDRIQASMAQTDQGAGTVKLLVARKQLPHGQVLSLKSGNDLLTWVDWPKESVPQGAFIGTMDGKDIFGDNRNQTRTVLRTIEPGELILRSKVSDFGEGVRLRVAEGMRAVTIPINAVTGGAGHISPGDRVDIEFTRSTAGNISSHILLWNVQVIAIDQRSETEQVGARLGSTATVEVTPTDARKLRLAMNAGALSLLLRNQDVVTNPVADPAPKDEQVIDLSVLPGAPVAVEPKPEPVVIEQKPVYQPRLPTGKSVPGVASD